MIHSLIHILFGVNQGHVLVLSCNHDYGNTRRANRIAFLKLCVTDDDRALMRK